MCTNQKSKALLCHPTAMRYWLNKNTTVIRIVTETNIQIVTVTEVKSGVIADGRVMCTSLKSKALLSHPTPMRYWLDKNTTVIRIGEIS